MSDLVTAIRQAAKGMIKPDLLLGEVLSFDIATWTIVVKLNQGSTVDDVTIKSVLNGEGSGILVMPEIGSKVLCGMTDGKIENLTVLVYSEIKEIRFVPSEKVILKGKEFGGLVKLSELEANLNTLKASVETILTATAAGLTSVGVGAAANGPAGASTFNSATSAINIVFDDMENLSVQHGE